MLLKISDYKYKFEKAADVDFFATFKVPVSGIERPSIIDPFNKVRQAKRLAAKERKRRNAEILRRAKVGVVS